MKTDNQDFYQQVRRLIDDLKSVCANYGLGNDGNEFKIISQIFLYKFLHDKFVFEMKELDRELKNTDDWERKLKSLGSAEFEIMTMKLSESSAIIKPDQLISTLFSRQNEDNFSTIFDSTLVEIARQNRDIFSVITGGGERISLFENLSKYVSDNKDEFCKAIINKLVGFSFENMFKEGFDFFATIFEYLIKDYNSDSGGKYAEYFTPHSVSGIMASCLVPTEKKANIANVTCYDPSAGSGTLLMNLAYRIGPNRCTIFSQDISQKSTNLLRLNLILNKLVHSINNIIQGNTLLDPAHRDQEFGVKKFDFIVSNPPFKLDFSDFRNELDKKENNERFFAGIPKIPAKKKESMAIYLLFLQHVIYSLKPDGKAAIVVPTGFITSKSGIQKKILQKLVDEKILSGVISMPSNIFAKTGTNVSVLFIDRTNKEKVVLIDASNLGREIKEDKNQKTILTPDEIDKIVSVFTNKETLDDFSVVVSYEEIIKKNYSLSAGQHFDIKFEYPEMTEEEFREKISNFSNEIDELFKKSKNLESEILSEMNKLNF